MVWVVLWGVLDNVWCVGLSEAEEAGGAGFDGEEESEFEMDEAIFIFKAFRWVGEGGCGEHGADGFVVVEVQARGS